MNESQQTDFGYTKVSPEQKSRKVREVFESVAGNYDLMNDLMSLGLHRLWKNFVLHIASVRPGQSVLDLAGGTGDLAGEFCKQVGEQGNVVLCDINASMLSAGREKLVNNGHLHNINYVQGNAEQLPFPDNQFDCVTMAFGLRNVTFKDQCLASVYTKLKPAGKFIVLEFSKPSAWLKTGL